MMRYCPLAPPLRLTALLLMLVPQALPAQHDPERNATRHLAANRPAQARKQLAEANPDDSERHFVAMLLALHEGRTEAAIESAQAALSAGLPFGRLVAGPRELLEPIRASAEFAEWRQANPTQLVHGPMLGCVTDDGASFWVRTASPATVRVRLFAEDEQQPIESPTAKTTAETDFTAVVRASGLRPSTTYRYEVSIDDQPVRNPGQRLRTSPKQGEPGRFSIAFGGGAGFVPERERMWNVIAEQRPDALLMLGDNVYIDDPKHSMTQRYCYYRRQSRPEWRSLVAATPTYSIWDDHDFATNDCIPGAAIDKPAWKRRVWQVFQQNWVNPGYGGGNAQPGCWYDFTIADVHFLMLDGRYYRSREGTPSMLGAAQKEWLFDRLENTTARIKVIASPVPFSPGVKPGSKDTWDGFSEEREALFDLIEEQQINGVILLAADRHRSDLRVTKRPDSYDLYEFESSKLTNRHTHPVVKTDQLLWGYNAKCSFGLVTFDTTKADPEILFEVVDIDGERVHSHTLYASDLRRDG